MSQTTNMLYTQSCTEPITTFGSPVATRGVLVNYYIWLEIYGPYPESFDDPAR
jgi:hypothetical protein